VSGQRIYSYVGNNPTNYRDPFGLKAVDPLARQAAEANASYTGSTMTDAAEGLSPGDVLAQVPLPMLRIPMPAQGNQSLNQGKKDNDPDAPFFDQRSGNSSTGSPDPCASFGIGCNDQETSRSGSGPRKGVIELSPEVRSNAAFRNYNPSKPVEYVYDPATNRLAVGNVGGHPELVRSINADPKTVVGGMFVRGANGEILTNEASGHFYQNWTPTVRAQFQREVGRMSGQTIAHTPGM
jgi:hypothetical protein